MPADQGRLLLQFIQSVVEMEAGQCPPGCPDHDSALAGLLAEICGGPWKTAEERCRAQGLVGRLERLR
jgi:hypothetical protein